MLRPFDLWNEFRVRGTGYDFDDVGDALETHTHITPESNHSTWVLRGSLRIIGHSDHAGQIIVSGDMIVWPLGVEHGFVALEPKSRIANPLRG